MLEIIAQLPIGFVVALSGVMIPGPLLAFIVARTPVFGPRTGTLAATGHIMVELGLIFIIVLGMGTILENRSFQIAIYGVGGSSLIVLATATLSKLQKTERILPSVETFGPLLGGVLFSTILNPTVILWWATIGTAMLMDAWLVASSTGVTLWVIGHYLADLSWYSLVSYSVSRGNKVLGTSPHRTLLGACSFILLILGTYFIIRLLLALS